MKRCRNKKYIYRLNFLFIVWLKDICMYILYQLNWISKTAMFCMLKFISPNVFEEYLLKTRKLFSFRCNNGQNIHKSWFGLDIPNDHFSWSRSLRSRTPLVPNIIICTLNSVCIASLNTNNLYHMIQKTLHYVELFRMYT